MSRTDEPRRSRAGRPRVGLWVALGFVALQLGWILAVPPFAGIDEIDHAYRASAVAEGHWRASTEQVPPSLGGGDYLWVRSDVVRAAGSACEHLDADRPARCRPAAHHASEVKVASSAARYDPAFYAVVGAVARPFTGTSALYAMRLAAATVSALLLWASVWATRTWARTRWPVVGILLSVTPATVYATSVVAPNGAEILSGLLLWTALIGFVEDRDPRHRRALAALAGLAAVLLVGLHSLGVVWAALTALTLWIGYGSRRLVASWRGGRRPVAAVVLTTAGCLAALFWIVAARTNDPRADPVYDYHLRLGPLLESLRLWPLQAVAAFPDRFHLAPPIVYLLLAPLMVGVLVGAIAVAHARRERRLVAAVGMVLATSALVPVVATLLTYRHLGIGWQGRYGLPYAVGALVIGALVLDRSARSRDTWWLGVAAAGTVVASLVGQINVANPWRGGPIAPGAGVGSHDLALYASATVAAICLAVGLRSHPGPSRTVGTVQSGVAEDGLALVGPGQRGGDAVLE